MEQNEEQKEQFDIRQARFSACMPEAISPAEKDEKLEEEKVDLHLFITAKTDDNEYRLIPASVGQPKNLFSY